VAGYDLDVGASNKTSTLIFSIPLRDVRVHWGNPIYIATTPTASQVGYVYRLNKNNLEYVTAGAKGLMAIPYTGGLAITSLQNELLTTEVVGGDAYSLALATFPEKCTIPQHETRSLFCATPVDLPLGEYPDDWYKGKVSFNDILWHFDIANFRSTVLSDFLLESGREIDVASIGTNDDGQYIYFVNKNDNTLWVFDTTVNTQNNTSP
jgi:hypothetical protein